MLFRSTVATLSLMFGVAIAGSLLVVAILGDNAARWLLPTDFLTLVLGGFLLLGPERLHPVPRGVGHREL
ncbi:hypothetical protein GCM10009641_77260 [Mycobacterium cookii]|uniref:Uncharacterized protein n=1 Tax=Nocardioides furvisabuli TaxID=375542 RepID=A0ABN2XDD6_9ACTN|nr:hypothetical protein [Nocardioides furvisabuli]